MRASFYERNMVTQGGALLGGVGLEIDGGCYEKEIRGGKAGGPPRLSPSKKRGRWQLRRPS
ncbi:hypothetical protein A2U01_0102354 [Trifolium medium]|uniref:Uncharacterized protein n=1 Tax=Trifolium medium TaxID=97028 RepID=A0A392V0Z5_9FABA|nr:hypothetical protein [Trifolium medium]